MGNVPDSGWRIRKDAWPNGREYWEIVHPDGFQLVGSKGGVTRYYDKTQAQDARDHMNCKPKRDKCPVVE